jgi:pimeloyl-ACP methyl ester carboxylesterase
MGILTYDQIGQHESDGSDDPADYALPRVAMDLADLIEQAARRLGREDPPHLIGHSFGGLVAQQAVAMGVVRPASLVLLCTGPGAVPAHRWGALPHLVDALPHTSLDELWTRKREIERANALAAGQAADLDPQVEAFLEARWMRNHPEQLRSFGQHLMSQESLTDLLVDRLGSRIPVAVLWGEHDDIWPIPMQAELAQRLGTEGIEIPGGSHSPNADDPAGLVQALAQAWGMQLRTSS